MYVYLLNTPSTLSTSLVTTGCRDGNTGNEMAHIRSMVNSTPTGRTPLCATIRKVIARIKREEHDLRANGKRAVVVIASDGSSTDGDIVQAMKPLQTLPVWVVIRLCTDDDDVVDYWNNVDNDLELDMDVLDDIESEAKQVTSVNKWLTYGRPLHLLREFGTSAKVLDLLDEKSLSATEVAQLAGLIIGEHAEDLPHPDMGWSRFESALETALRNEKHVWDPIKKKYCPWISVKKLRHKMGKGNCTCM